MKRIGKREIHRYVKKHINTANVKVMLLFVPLLMILMKKIESGEFRPEMFLDASILISFLIVFLCEILANVIINFVELKTEDAVKITEDYESLINTYRLEKPKMVSYHDGDKTVYVPAISQYEVKIANHNLSNAELSFEFDNSRYHVPKQIADNSEFLFTAHKHSVIYNRMNIRVNDIITEGNTVKVVYGFTTYYDSLITNRAMDYRFSSNRSIRDIYEPGPIISDLKDSKMSNHLGFGGFIELSDGHIVFVKRKKYLSIGKGVWQQSVGASLKTEACLDENRLLTREGLFNAIKKEVYDELKIEIPDSDISKISIFSFFRDLVEGGKPQFVFYYRTDEYDRKSFEDNFYHYANRKDNKSNSARNKTETDGDIFEYFTVEELKNCKFLVDRMTDQKNRQFIMTASSIASIILFLRNI